MIVALPAQAPDQIFEQAASEAITDRQGSGPTLIICDQVPRPDHFTTEAASQSLLLDFSGKPTVPQINILDPDLHQSQEACVNTIIQTLKSCWSVWSPKAELLLHDTLSAVYDHNANANTATADRLSFLDVQQMLVPGPDAHRGKLTSLQSMVLGSVTDPHAHRRISQRLAGPTAQPPSGVAGRLNAMVKVPRVRATLGQKQSRVSRDDLTRPGATTVVATGTSMGMQAAALMGAVLISITAPQPDAMIACNDAAHWPGTPWTELSVTTALLIRTSSLQSAYDSELKRLLKEATAVACFKCNNRDASEAARIFGGTPAALSIQGADAFHMLPERTREIWSSTGGRNDHGELPFRRTAELPYATAFELSGSGNK